jgi:hypothetical protein
MAIACARWWHLAEEQLDRDVLFPEGVDDDLAVLLDATVRKRVPVRRFGQGGARPL